MPHCNVAVHDNFDQKTSLFSGRKRHSQHLTQKWIMELMTCPACKDDIIFLIEALVSARDTSNIASVSSHRMTYPEGASRALPSSHVPEIKGLTRK